MAFTFKKTVEHVSVSYYSALLTSLSWWTPDWKLPFRCCWFRERPSTHREGPEEQCKARFPGGLYYCRQIRQERNCESADDCILIAILDRVP